MLTTDFSFGRRLRKPHIGQYIGITRGRIKSLAEFFFFTLLLTQNCKVYVSEQKGLFISDDP